MQKKNSHRNDPFRAARFQQAIDYARAGNRTAAKRIMRELVARYPQEPAVLGYLAGLYLDSNQRARALPLFRRTVQLSPKSERASVGLFHTLWGLGMTDAAFDEMRRFVTLSDSKEYTRLLKEMNAERVRHQRPRRPRALAAA